MLHDNVYLLVWQQEIELKDTKIEDTHYSFLEMEDINDAGSQEKMVCCKDTGDKVNQLKYLFFWQGKDN